MESPAFLFNDYSITSDGIQFILKRRRIVKDSPAKKNIGKERWDTIGFFSNLSCVHYRIANLLCCKHIGELSVAVQEIKELKKMMINLTAFKHE